jgi:hypothetical protein
MAQRGQEAGAVLDGPDTGEGSPLVNARAGMDLVPAEGVPPVGERAAKPLETELRALKLGALSRRAKEAGATADEVELMQDEGDPRGALIAFIVAQQDDGADVREKLGALKLGALSRRAIVVGVAEEALEVAQDSDAPKAAIIELIIAQGLGLVRAKLAGLAETPRPAGLSATPPPGPHRVVGGAQSEVRAESPLTGDALWAPVVDAGGGGDEEGAAPAEEEPAKQDGIQVSCASYRIGN